MIDKGGEETGVPWRKPLAMSFRKCHIINPEDSSPKPDSNPQNSISGRLGKQTCQPLHHASSQHTRVLLGPKQPTSQPVYSFFHRRRSS